MNFPAIIRFSTIATLVIAVACWLFQVTVSGNGGTRQQDHGRVSSGNKEQGPHTSSNTPKRKGKEGRVTPVRSQADLDKIVGWTLRPYEQLFNQRERFSTLDENGLLTEEAIREAGLLDQEVSACREIFARDRQRVQSLIKANLVPDRTDPGDPAVEEMFYIKAFPMEGSESFQTLFKELGEAVGEQKKNAVLGGFSVRSATSYGNRNAHVKIYAADPGESEGRTVRIEYYDALNSELTGSSVMPIEAFRATFGAIDGLR